MSSKAIKTKKVNDAIRYFEKSMDYLNRQIDRRHNKGKTNEESNFADKHLKRVLSDGTRCWSF